MRAHGHALRSSPAVVRLVAGGMAVAGMVVALATGCSDGGSRTARATTTTSSTTTTTVATAPVLRDEACPGGFPTDSRVSCHRVVVPLDRAHPRGPTMALFVAVVKGTGTPDPVVYFSGGPGGVGVTADRVRRYLTTDPTSGRDVVLFDQRGTGRSGPSLECPEVSAAALDVLSGSQPRATVVPPAIRTAFDACYRRLAASGVDLGVYNTEISADDAEDIRLALGYDRWNLFGISYGTTVALAVLQRHPDHVRSAVIDSVLSTTSPDSTQNLTDRLLSGRARLLQGCAADLACNKAYPDLSGTISRVIARYNAAPHPVKLADPTVAGGQRTVQITGDDISAGLIRAQYDETYLPLLPNIIHALDKDQTGVIDTLASSGLDFWTGLSAGDAVAVECADRQRLTAGDGQTDPTAHPELALFLAGAAVLDNCATWKVPPVSTTFNRPVHSDVPTLVMAGAFDPIIPPEQSKAVADELGHALFVEIANGGHGPIYSSPCTTSIFTAFLRAGDTSIDTSCAQAIRPPTFVLPK